VVSGDSNLGYTRPRGLDFHVLSAAAAEDPDFFVYFGDTIYADSGVLPGGSAFALDEYREVHRLTRADPHLQDLLGSTATFSGWDDHEVRNDYDGETVDPVQFENGAQAFFEYLPLRKNPTGPAYRIDRSVRFGQHVELFFLDGRQFRSAEKFCNPDPIPDGPETMDTLFSPFVEDEVLVVQVDPVLGPLAAQLLLLPSDPDCVTDVLEDPSRTILGADQMAALQQALLDSTATFKILINNTPISKVFVSPYDRWEGYAADQHELLDFVAANLDPSRTLVLTTDFHTNMAIQRPELTDDRPDDVRAVGAFDPDPAGTAARFAAALPAALRRGRGPRQRRGLRAGDGARCLLLRPGRRERWSRSAHADSDRARQSRLSGRGQRPERRRRPLLVQHALSGRGFTGRRWELRRSGRHEAPARPRAGSSRSLPGALRGSVGRLPGRRPAGPSGPDEPAPGRPDRVSPADG
jgi:hypothetical protein